MDREKEREIELESAMYTNCLLLGLDPVIIGIGSINGTPRVGLFRHSNPKLGEQLLYFILSSLRGPIQSAKANSMSRTFFFTNMHFLFDCYRSCFRFASYYRTSIRFGQFSIRLSPGIFGRCRLLNFMDICVYRHIQFGFAIIVSFSYLGNFRSFKQL